MAGADPRTDFIRDMLNTGSSYKFRLMVARYLKANGVKLQKLPHGCACFSDQLAPQVLAAVYAMCVKEYNDDLIDFSDIGKKREDYEKK
jgi:hypothetical protein